MYPPILLLPSELKRLIVELSSGSLSSLAALARTHTAYQREAERALYETLYIFTFSNHSLKCMETLATNPKKADLVRFLTIEYVRDTIDKNQRVTTYLSDIMMNMHSLSDFRVRSWHSEAKELMKNLGKNLCEGHFRLQTLYCHDFLDISQILKNQTELRVLGIYTNGNQRFILKTLKEFHNAQLFLPIILTLDHESFVTITDHIGIFPAFYSVDRCATIRQVLAQSLCKDQGHYMVAKGDNVTQLSIYLTDSSDMPFIKALVKDMTVGFPRIDWLNLWFEHRCEIPSQEIEEEFSSFSDVYTYTWSDV